MGIENMKFASEFLIGLSLILVGFVIGYIVGWVKGWRDAENG